MYTIKQAATRSGVNVPLLRAWERRYRIVSPSRTEAGYRLYDDDAIERLRAMRTLVDGGWSPRQAAERVNAATDDEVAAIAAESRDEQPVDAGAPTVDAFVGGAMRIDAGAIERAIDEMFASGSFERVVQDHVYPALHALGDAWESGAVDVAGEHAASAAMARRLSMAFEAAAAPSSEPPVLVGLPPGARHELASLAFATAARRAGLPVVYLGPDVPLESWVAAVERTGARAAVLGVVMERDAPAAESVVAALREARSDLVVGIGGRAAEQVTAGSAVRLPDDRLLDAVEALRLALG